MRLLRYARNDAVRELIRASLMLIALVAIVAWSYYTKKKVSFRSYLDIGSQLRPVIIRKITNVMDVNTVAR